MRLCLVVFIVLERVGPLEQVLTLVAYAAHGLLGGFFRRWGRRLFYSGIFSVKT